MAEIEKYVHPSEYQTFEEKWRGWLATFRAMTPEEREAHRKANRDEREGLETLFRETNLFWAMILKGAIEAGGGDPETDPQYQKALINIYYGRYAQNWGGDDFWKFVADVKTNDPAMA